MTLAPSPEVKTLRRLDASIRQRHRAILRLCTRYAAGRRSAVQIVHALRALRDQMDLTGLRDLAYLALDAVVPVPTVLWTWVCSHVDLLNAATLRNMLRVADADARCARHVDARVAAVLHQGL